VCSSDLPDETSQEGTQQGEKQEKGPPNAPKQGQQSGQNKGRQPPKEKSPTDIKTDRMLQQVQTDPGEILKRRVENAERQRMQQPQSREERTYLPW